ncbi:MAG TPA: PE family protein [Mycobacterium sp.]|nr:PE family protein [Mycobacterium sp.]
MAVPEFVASAATDLSNIGSGLSVANAVAAAPTTAVVAAAGDEVSAAIASLFSGHAKGFQALSARAAAFSCRVCARLKRCGGRVFADRGGQRLAVGDRRA